MAIEVLALVVGVTLGITVGVLLESYFCSKRRDNG